MALLGAVLAGCGVKGPPVPDRSPPLPAVSALSFELNDAAAALRWRLAGGLPREQARRAVFTILRSRQALADPACEGCTLVFEKVARVAYAETAHLTFGADVTLEPGYRYAFKVRLEAGGRVGGDSQTVRFDHTDGGPLK